MLKCFLISFPYSMTETNLETECTVVCVFTKKTQFQNDYVWGNYCQDQALKRRLLWGFFRNLIPTGALEESLGDQELPKESVSRETFQQSFSIILKPSEIAGSFPSSHGFSNTVLAIANTVGGSEPSQRYLVRSRKPHSGKKLWTVNYDQ